MSELIPYLLAAPAVLMIGTMFVPSRFAQSGVKRLRAAVTTIAGLQFVVAAILAIMLIAGYLKTFSTTLVSFADGAPLEIGVYYDGVSALMLTLVSFVGWIICRYSVRYLDGESTQGRYFRWTAFTIGSVSLLVVSGNLLMFVGCWMMTSLGLHQLLLHYGHRPAAHRAAWTKFTISRIGDAALIVAITLIFLEFRTLNFAELFAAVESFNPASSAAVTAAGFLLVIGAVTKSAQFPFHTWLPQTMETPTPVSALMHAGIVNAGGYLIIRTSPLVSLTPWALTTLAIVGGFTACFAAVVMLTQTSVKKSLAYSTIAQMGFMMLQCGLGAFSAAMLHILAHSLYKAHAFLTSGSVMSQRSAMQGALPASVSVAWTKLAIVGSVIAAFFALALVLFGVDVTTKSGGLLLGGILCLALTHFVGAAMKKGTPGLLAQSLAIAGFMCVAYVASFVMVDHVVASSLPKAAGPSQLWIVATIVSAGFIGLFALHALLENVTSQRRLHALYVHASNGFYMENSLRRLFGPLVSN